MTTVCHARQAKPGTATPCLYSETHTEERIGHREWARGNGSLGDIHSADDRFEHHIDELMA